MPWRTPLAALAILAATVMPAAAEDLAYVIRPGDTPVALAKAYHVPVAAILARNTQLDPCRLKVGDVLYVPLDAKPPARADSKPPARADSKPAASDLLPDEEPPGGCYVVAPGDCPASIAARFHVSVESLVRVNPGIEPTNLPVGRVLAIPVDVAPAPPPVSVARPGASGPAVPLAMDFQ